MIDNRDLLSKICIEYGSPCYLFDKKSFVTNYQKFEGIMKSEYDKYQIAYSYKTNYAPYICRLVKSLGGYAEVVSDMEYYFAKQNGYCDKKIIYNGPCKGNLAKKMLLGGGMLNIDNLEELNEIVNFARENTNCQLNIGLRLNIDIGQSFVSRFGIDADSEELVIALKMIGEVDNLSVFGLHCHIGQSRTLQAWENRAKRVLDIVDRYFKNVKLKYIDLGSGMYGEMEQELSDQFGIDLPSYEEYAKTIGKVFRKYYDDWKYEDKPILFTEPGTTLINHYIDFVGTVYSIKHIRGKEFVVLDCSKNNLGEICTLKKLPISIIHNGKKTETLSDAKFVGYTCLEHDVMYSGYKGDLAVGDYVVFGNVGGYSNVDKPPFILPNCPMISVEGENVELIKNRETYDDVLSTYTM